MSISLETVVLKYLDVKKLSGGTRKEYKSTIAKWLAWEGRVDVDKIERTHIREFLDWVHEKAIEGGGSNPGRTANKARENLRAILSWAGEQDFIERLPRFPKPKPASEELDGTNLLPLLVKQQPLQRKGLYWHYPHYHHGGASPYGVIRKGRYRLVEHFDGTPAELYDIEDDIGETMNLVNTMPEKVKELLNELRQW